MISFVEQLVSPTSLDFAQALPDREEHALSRELERHPVLVHRGRIVAEVVIHVAERHVIRVDVRVGLDRGLEHREGLIRLLRSEVSRPELEEDGSVREHALCDPSPESQRLFHLALIGKEVANQQEVFPLVHRVNDRRLPQFHHRLFEGVAHHIAYRLTEVAGNEERVALEGFAEEVQPGLGPLGTGEDADSLSRAALDLVVEVGGRRLLLDVPDTPGGHRVFGTGDVLQHMLLQ